MIKQISVKSIVLLNIQGYCDNEEPLIIYTVEHEIHACPKYSELGSFAL